jgi:uncharacterized pyridoxamine 5'-phosphate oxidase family protein
MDLKKEFLRIMESDTHIVLATSVDNVPNVRTVFFYYDAQKEGIVYIMTFNHSPKAKEFSKNNKVAFTTIPVGGDVVRVLDATIQKSQLSVTDIKDQFINKYPVFQAIYDSAGAMMSVYEIHFKEADVILGIMNRERISL